MAQGGPWWGPSVLLFLRADDISLAILALYSPISAPATVIVGAANCGLPDTAHSGALVVQASCNSENGTIFNLVYTRSCNYLRSVIEKVIVQHSHHQQR